MPYANIYYVKLKLELLNEKRFIFDLTPEQRYLYTGLLLLAGDTKNKVPDDENFIKNRLNLPDSLEKIRESLELIIRLFRGITRKNGYIKFNNFNKLHNQVKDSGRIPEEYPKVSVDKVRIDKVRLDKIIEKYIEAKGWNVKDNKPLLGDIYKRACKPAKQLYLLVNDEVLACELIGKISKMFETKKLSWTLETIIKHLPDYLSAPKKKETYVKSKIPERPVFNEKEAKEIRELVKDVAKKCDANKR
ncbi:hypothetical protein LCGC14_2218230 [marine sediment metagenome]|uniref:Uncharacterized protein n=1 Tax=marine sediment metagenome TaxID=412755 RepID=A0A0F9DBV2_9ZZZZ